MVEFFKNIDLDAFWLNILVGGIFFILSIPLAIIVIPYFTIKQLKRKNKKFIIRKVSSVIQEICEFLNTSPFKDKELNKHQLAIYTSKKDLKNYRFIGLINLNVFNQVTFPKIVVVVAEKIQGLSIDNGFELIKNEKNRIKVLRENLEKIIEIHSLHIDEETISNISEVCLEIRSFEITFEYNYGIYDLIEKGLTKRNGIFGIMDLAKLHEKILILLKSLLNPKDFETEITLNV
jgi:hypothetical protein